MDVKALWTYIVLINCLTIRGEDENLTSTEMYFGCSFSSDDWCNNANVYNGSNGPSGLDKRRLLNKIRITITTINMISGVGSFE